MTCMTKGFHTFFVPRIRLCTEPGAPKTNRRGLGINLGSIKGGWNAIMLLQWNLNLDNREDSKSPILFHLMVPWLSETCALFFCAPSFAL